MVILTSVHEGDPRFVIPGDTFRLTVGNRYNFGETVILEEEITEAKTIDYYCSFRFARDDGTLVGFHLCGFFGNRNELPDEIRNGVRIQDLTPEQYGNMCRSIGIKI